MAICPIIVYFIFSTWRARTMYDVASFSTPEAALLLVSTKNRGLWPWLGSTAIKWVSMLKPRTRDRACVGMGSTISIETNKRQNGGRFKFHYLFSFRRDKVETKQLTKGFYFKHSSKRASLLYIFLNKETISATIVNFRVEFTCS